MAGMERTTGYARLGSQRIAYEVAGSGPTDLVVTAGSFGAFDVVQEMSRTMTERWGTEQHVALQVPSRADDARFRRWYAKKTRSIAGPAAVAAFFRLGSAADARALLPAIHAPTLVMHRSGYH